MLNYRRVSIRYRWTFWVKKGGIPPHVGWGIPMEYPEGSFVEASKTAVGFWLGNRWNVGTRPYAFNFNVLTVRCNSHRFFQDCMSQSVMLCFYLLSMNYWLFGWWLLVIGAWLVLVLHLWSDVMSAASMSSNFQPWSCAWPRAESRCSTHVFRETYGIPNWPFSLGKCRVPETLDYVWGVPSWSSAALLPTIWPNCIKLQRTVGHCTTGFQHVSNLLWRRLWNSCQQNGACARLLAGRPHLVSTLNFQDYFHRPCLDPNVKKLILNFKPWFGEQCSANDYLFSF